MSDSNDTRVSNAELRVDKTASTADLADLLKNILDPVAIDGSRTFSLEQYIRGIAASLSYPGMPPTTLSVFAHSDTTAHKVVDCPANMSIAILDMFLSVNAAATITFVDVDGNNIMSPFYAPNAGQGFTRNVSRGLILPAGKSLYVQSSAAVGYGGDVSFFLLNSE